MSAIYDNWERLVAKTLDREKLRDLALASSRETSFSSSITDGDSYLSQTCSFNSAPQDIPVGSSATRTIPGGVAAGAARLFAAPALAIAWFRRRKRQDRFSDVPIERYYPDLRLGLLKRFSLRELQVATDHFSNINILGRGQFGNHYKGRLADGSLVAVKRLQVHPYLNLQFQTEVEMMDVGEHRNLLRLRGFCMTRVENLLVYPYMANGSLALWLRDRPESRPPLNWAIRKQIALGAARGLSYLHDECDPKIIHRDVKAANILLDKDIEAKVCGFSLAKRIDSYDTDVAANILLDKDFEAKVCGFSLAKRIDSYDTDVTTAVRGTIGHIAPEYLSTGKCSVKTDVFGYGVMLLELISGQRASDLARLASDEDVRLLDWVKGVLKEKNLERVVDKDLVENTNYIDSEVVEELIQVALLCTQSSPIERPEMSEVIRMLEGNGLAERWEEYLSWSENPQPPNNLWITEDTDIEEDTLSEPR